jgi:hypothetical protein
MLFEVNWSASRHWIGYEKDVGKERCIMVEG